MPKRMCLYGIPASLPRTWVLQICLMRQCPTGLEWNVKVTAKDLPETIEKIGATFESYWNSPDFDTYQKADQQRLVHALRAEKYRDSNDDKLYLVDIHPYPFQQEILDQFGGRADHPESLPQSGSGGYRYR